MTRPDSPVPLTWTFPSPRALFLEKVLRKANRYCKAFLLPSPKVFLPDAPLSLQRPRRGTYFFPEGPLSQFIGKASEGKES